MKPSVWARAATTISTLWPIPWPMATGTLLILLVGWLVPLVPDALSGVGQGIAVAWNWLRLTGDGSPAVVTNAETVRNVSLTLGGPLALVALWLAWRRTFDARRQTETQIRQSQTQIEQAKTAERARQSERFEVAVQSLARGQATAEIVAVETLVQICRENPTDFGFSVLRILADNISIEDNMISRGKMQENYPPNSKINEKIWDIILNSSDFLIPRTKRPEIIVQNTRAVNSIYSLDECYGVEFRGVEFGSIMMGEILGHISIHKSTIYRLFIASDIVFVDTMYWSLFDSCVFGMIEVSIDVDVSEEIFRSMFSRCTYTDGSEVSFPLNIYNREGNS